MYFAVKPENTNLTTTANTSAVLLNSVVTFHCTAEASPPTHDYLFYHEQTLLGSNSSGTFDTQVSKSGQYYCVPVNVAGRGDNDSISITVVGKYCLELSCAGCRAQNICKKHLPNGQWILITVSQFYSQLYTGTMYNVYMYTLLYKHKYLIQTENVKSTCRTTSVSVLRSPESYKPSLSAVFLALYVGQPTVQYVHSLQYLLTS